GGRGARVRRGGPGGQQRRPVDLQAAAGDHRPGLGPAARRDGARVVPGLPRGRRGAAGAGPRRRHRLHLQQELTLRGPEQRRVRGHQGRRGPPGPASRGRTGVARHPGQRDQPRRRRPRLRDLRRRLGRRAGQGLRGRGGGPRRVLRQADAARQGGPAGARRRGRVRADRRRPGPDHRAARPGRLRRRRGVPAMSGPVALAAVDLGASSGRVVLGRVGPDTLELTEVSRFRNGPVPLPDGLYWDAPGLYLDILDGIRVAERRSGGLAGLAIDSWGVDYGLLDADGVLLGNPRHYRDGRTAAVLDDVHRTLDPARLYQLTGAQFLPFSTLYQLAAERRLEAGWQALLMPDLLGYWLTGVRAAEQTIASTTGLLDARTGDWAAEVVEALGLPTGLLPDVVLPGRMLAGVTEPVRAELGLDH